ncbi:MAG: alpha-amylase family glycosyl hydrolase, partial [Candidatus Sericytochromatia bacterium]
MAASIEFTLLAPYNEIVLLQGDFSDWQDLPMQKDGKGIWRCSVELADGAYEYRFRLKSLSWFWEPGKWVQLIDPWATQVDEEKDTALILIQDGKRMVAPYDWEHDTLEQVDPLATVAYEIYIGDFAADQQGQGTFAKTLAKLDYLAELGINAIQCMPIMEFPGRKSWGYNPAYPFATEAAYGPPIDFKRLVDAAHGQRIRFFADMLFNHVTQDCRLTWIDYDYWFSREPSDPDWNWGPEFNYDKHDENYDRWPAWEFAGQVVDFWLQEYHIDGIRYDAVKQLGHSEFLSWVTARADKMSGPKPFFNIAERIPDTPDVLRPQGPMDCTWHDTFCHNVRDMLCGKVEDPDRLKEVLDPRRRGYTSPLQLINYLSNHDQPRLITALVEAGLSAEVALQRNRLAVVLLLTNYGIPMLRMGDEFGEGRGVAHQDQHMMMPIDWESLTREPGSSLYQLHKDLIALRAAHPALRQGNVNFIHEDGLSLAWLRSLEQDQAQDAQQDHVLIAANLRDEPMQAKLSLPKGKWQRFGDAQTA